VRRATSVAVTSRQPLPTRRDGARAPVASLPEAARRWGDRWDDAPGTVKTVRRATPSPTAHGDDRIDDHQTNQAHDALPPGTARRADEEATVYAVIATGGKQYRVQPGDDVVVEKLAGEVGDTVTLTPVLVVDDEGQVTTGGDLGDRTVSATITGHGAGPKIRVFTYKNKSRQHKRRGHRQQRTTLRIDDL
jgi:large subunit ribosomal protein L21